MSIPSRTSAGNWMPRNKPSAPLRKTFSGLQKGMGRDSRCKESSRIYSRTLSMQFANDHLAHLNKRMEQVLFLWQVIYLKTKEPHGTPAHSGFFLVRAPNTAQVQKLNAYVAPMMPCVNRPVCTGDAKATFRAELRNAQLSGAWSGRRGPFCRCSPTGGLSF